MPDGLKEELRSLTACPVSQFFLFVSQLVLVLFQEDEGGTQLPRLVFMLA